MVISYRMASIEQKFVGFVEDAVAFRNRNERLSKLPLIVKWRALNFKIFAYFLFRNMGSNFMENGERGAHILHWQLPKLTWRSLLHKAI